MRWWLSEGVRGREGRSRSGGKEEFGDLAQDMELGEDGGRHSG